MKNKNHMHDIILLSGEEIRDVLDYENLYAITSYGRVWSYEKIRKFGINYRTIESKFLKQVKDKDDYLCIGLHYKSKRVKRRIHRLVAKAFIKNPNNLPVVNHNTDKQNNYKDNLEWVTVENNNNHAIINRVLRKTSSNFYGVYFHKTLRGPKKWIAKVTIDKKEIHIGSYETELDAVRSYDNFIIENNINRPLNFL